MSQPDGYNHCMKHQNVISQVECGTNIYTPGYNAWYVARHVWAGGVGPQLNSRLDPIIRAGR